MVSVATLALGGPLPSRHAEHEELNSNQRFACYYGFPVTAIAAWGNDSETVVLTYWKRAAVPIMGDGKTITEIVVKDSPSSTPSHVYAFSVGIYSGTHHPKSLLVSKQVNPAQVCGPVTVQIPPTKLHRLKSYWVVETATTPSPRHRCCYSSSNENAAIWLYEKSQTQGALWQSGYSCNGSSCPPAHSQHHSPWQAITGGVPYARVR